MEILDLYSDDGVLIGKTIERGSKVECGNVMLSIVFIRNSEGKFLIQKTSEEKDSCYTSTGGHVVHGEDGLTTIIRELEEELGVICVPHDLIKIDLVKNPKRPCLINLFLLEKDLKIEDLILQKEEVSSVEWMDKDKILKLIDNGSFLESHGYLFKKYFA